jgi:EAL domain-containing protein (putative c-di-GMP-specific phosphodiesterase class I)
VSTRHLGRVLVVDDDEMIRVTCALALRRDGWDVTAVGDGQAALETLAEHVGLFDCVVSDVNMPGLDGFQLLAALRERDDDLPVLLMTGEPSMTGAMQAVASGAVLYVGKPFNVDEMQEAVARAARRHGISRMKRRSQLMLAADDSTAAADRAALAMRFDDAIAKLWMAFQPIVDSRTRAVVAYEALLRTDEPSLMRPDILLGAAERLNRVHDVGRAVRNAVAAVADAAAPDTMLFVNLHGLDLNDEHLYAPSAPLSSLASRVILEITERVALDGVPDAAKRIDMLRRMGYRIAVDDLGAGYAGLASLAALEPEIVKLDMSLVRGIAENKTKRRVVGAMATLCRELGSRVVAEGIETEEEYAATLEAGVELLQGYLFARPARGFATVVGGEAVAPRSSMRIPTA